MTLPMPAIDIQPEHWDIVRNILHTHVPQYAVWAFGSRATGKAKKYSDLDLAVISDKPLSLDIIASLHDDFSESDLPYKVDVVDWATTSESFRKIIERDKVVVQEGEIVYSINDWKFLKLRDCATWYSGGTPSKSNPAYWGGSIPWISAKSLTDFFIHDSFDKVTELGVKNGTRIVPKDSILFIVRGMSLKSEFRMGISTTPVTFNQDVKALVANKDVVPLFLAYSMKGRSNEILSLVGEAGHGTGVLPTDRIQDLDIPLPPLPVQRRIADILGALDDKIELNRRMNATLEAMARALFKSWFVDFDPVHAKAAGQPTGLPAHIDALFPSAFVDSPLGQIPQGWGVGRLDDLLILQRGFDLPGTSRSIGKFPVVSAGGISGYHDKFMVKGPGVTTGRSGVLGNVFYISDDYWPLNTSLYIKSFLKATPLYAFYILQTVDFNLFNAGSAVPSLNRNHVHNLPVVLPPDECIKTFDMYSQSKIDLQQIYSLQSDNLTHLRDTLLPKLLSGEVEV